VEDWQKFGWLKAHKTNRNEIAELLAVADRDLGASKTPGLHNDWGFNIAYNAALQIATAALAASGYQAERANHHYRVIDSLSLTLGTDAGSIKKFDIFRKKRNISDYERADTISASGRKASGGLRSVDTEKPSRIKTVILRLGNRS
jgi:hypothetical protein